MARIVPRRLISFPVPTVSGSGTVNDEPGESAVLEDWVSVRTNGDGDPLWAPYLGEDPDQVGTLEDGYYQVVTAGSSAVYLQFVPRGEDGYNYPDGYAQAWIRSGTWDTEYNRLTFLVQTNVTVNRNSNGSDNVQWGTYVRDPARPEPNYQGRHFYHLIGANWRPNVWVLVVMNNCPQHEVGQDPGTNWGNDPTYPPVHYMDGLTRHYWDTQGGTSFDGSTWLFPRVWAFSRRTGEPDAEISSITAQYNGTQYQVTWAGVKNEARTYEIRYHTSSLKVAGWSAGTNGGTTTNPNNDYTGCIWSLTTAEFNPTGIYVGIRVQGETDFTEVYIPYQMGPDNMGY